MKSKRADIEFYRAMMEHFQEECASKSTQLASLHEENRALREELRSMAQTHSDALEELRQSNINELRELRESHRKELRELGESHSKELAELQEKLEEKLGQMAEINAGLSMQLSDALASGRLARARKYGRSSEQRDLLNNRKRSSRRSEEDDSDGTPPQTPCGDAGDGNGRGDAAAGGSGADAVASPAGKTKTVRKSRKAEKPEGEMHFDDVIEHPCLELSDLPAGARLLPGTMQFRLLKFIPARTECHIYNYNRYILERDDDKDVFVDTLPREIRDLRPADGCPFSAEVLAFIMTQRYAYHQPQRRIRMMLRDMGVHIPKKTFNRYVLSGADALLEMLGKAYREECRQGGYFMIDETVVTVGVTDKEHGRRYLNRYMWEFYNRTAGLVEYVYENGSRGQDVLKKFFGDGLPLLKAVISCDGYNAYRLFDSEAYPGVLVVGCWTHARRNFVEALESCRPQCEEVIGQIDRMFVIESECSEATLDPDQRLSLRKKRTKPILNTLKATLERMWNDTGLMAVSLLRKAVSYVRNQWDHLSNIIRTGVAEISNNLSEQRIRPVKLSQKNCLNIGSEEAASKHAFMYSLAESCRLNSVNIQDYFTCLFSKARSHLSDEQLRGLLPNHYPMKC